MPGFHLINLPSELLERVMPKLQEKEYFRMQRTCRDVEEFIRTNKRVRICSKRQPPPLYITADGYTTRHKFMQISLNGIYGFRFKVLRLPLGMEDVGFFVQHFCKFMKEHRITTEKLPFHYSKFHGRFTKEHCIKLFDALKPTKVIIRSYESDKFESLLSVRHLKNAQVFVDPDRVIEAVHMFFPRHSIAKVCTEDTQEHLLDLLLSVLQTVDNIPILPDTYLFEFCGVWGLAVVPPVKLLLDKLNGSFLTDDPFFAPNGTRIMCHLRHNDSCCRLYMERACVRIRLTKMDEDTSD